MRVPSVRVRLGKPQFTAKKSSAYPPIFQRTDGTRYQQSPSYMRAERAGSDHGRLTKGCGRRGGGAADDDVGAARAGRAAPLIRHGRDRPGRAATWGGGAEEILQHLTTLPGGKVTVTVDIQAETASGRFRKPAARDRRELPDARFQVARIRGVVGPSGRPQAPDGLRHASRKSRVRFRRERLYAARVATTRRCPTARSAASTWPICDRWSRSSKRPAVPSTIPKRLASAA